MSELRKILIPLDGSDFAEDALERGLELFPASLVQVLLLHCMESKEIFYYTSRLPARLVNDLLESDRDYHQDYLDRQVARVRARGYECQGLLAQGEPVEQILAVAQEQGCEQIVLTTHGRRGIVRMFLGSVAEGVVRRATIPVMVVPSTARD